MSCCSFPTSATAGYNLSNTSPRQLFPQLGQGVYMGASYPGSSNSVANNIDNLNPVVGGSIVIQTDGGYMSTLSAQPKNVLRLTGAAGLSYIQGSNINFSMPFSGTSGVSILPSTGTLTAQGLMTANAFYSNNQGNGQALMTQNYSTVLNTTSTIAVANLAWQVVGGGTDITLRANFYDAGGVLRYVKDFT